MILVYDQILDRVENYRNYRDVYAENECRPLIENFNKDNLQSVSYDVSISDVIMKSSNNFRTIRLENKVDIDKLFVEQKITNGYILAPNEYILVRLNEKINMPDDLTAHIRPRTTFNKIGLIINCQHINPSYNGNLQFGLKNMCNNAIEIIPNLIIGQLVFETLGGKIAEDILYRNKKNAKYQGEDGFITSKVYDESVKQTVKQLYENLLSEW